MSFLRSVSSLGRGDHACLIYDRVERRDAVLLEFLRSGILSGERVVYLADDADPRTVSELTALAGRDQLEVRSPHDTYLQAGEFDPDRVLGLLRAARNDAASERYPVLRLGGGPPAALTGNGQAHRLPRYERRANDLFADGSLLAVCAYDARATDPAALLGIIDAHSIVLYALGADPRLRVESSGAGKLRLVGWLDLTTLGGLVGPLSDAVADGTDLELDCSELDFVDVAGFRLLAEAADLFRARDAELRLVSLPEWVPTIIRLLGCDQLEQAVLR